MKITSSHRQLKEDDLRLAEQEMGVELPPDLRTFYLERNGGTPERRLFVKGDDGFLVQAFEPLARESEPKNNNVVKSFKTWRAVGDRDVLKEAIPIAYDAFGNLLLYSLDPNSFGAIYAAYHERPQSTDRVRFLCSSLTEFLEALRTK